MRKLNIYKLWQFDLMKKKTNTLYFGVFTVIMPRVTPSGRRIFSFNIRELPPPSINKFREDQEELDRKRFRHREWINSYYYDLIGIKGYLFSDGAFNVLETIEITEKLRERCTNYLTSNEFSVFEILKEESRRIHPISFDYTYENQEMHTIHWEVRKTVFEEMEKALSDGQFEEAVFSYMTKSPDLVRIVFLHNMIYFAATEGVESQPPNENY